MNAPSECRILTALLLQPMDTCTIAKCLSIHPSTAKQRVGFLRSSGEVEVGESGRYRKKTFRLTDEGKQWARELIA